VLVSTTGGATWSKISTPEMDKPVVSVVYRMEAGIKTLYASVWRKGVYRSTDLGGSWSIISSLPINSHSYQMRDINGTLYAAYAASIAAYTPRPGYTAADCPYPTVNTALTRNRCIPVHSSGALYRLTATGAWENLTAASGTLVLTDFAVDAAGSIYVGVADTPATPTKGGLWKSAGSGTFTQVASLTTTLRGQSQGYTDHIYAFAPTIVGDTIYVATVTHGIWKSTNQGATWAEAFPSMPFVAAQRVMQVGGELYVGTFGGGLWKLQEDTFQIVLVRDPNSGWNIPIVMAY
jgi:hypothetical protein